MKKDIIFLLIIFFLVSVELSFLNFIKIFQTKIDLLLLIIILLSFYSGTKSFYFSLYAGLLRDIFGILPFGFYGFVFSTTNFIFTTLKERVFEESMLTRILFPFFFALFFYFFSYLCLRIFYIPRLELLLFLKEGTLAQCIFISILFLLMEKPAKKFFANER